MSAISLQDASLDLSGLIERVEAGEDIVIERFGEAVARLVPVKPVRDTAPKQRQLGLLAGRGTVPDDFDDPLPDEIIALFEGR